MADLTLMSIERSRSEKQEENGEEYEKRAGDDGDEGDEVPEPMVVVVAPPEWRHLCVLVPALWFGSRFYNEQK